MTQLDILSKPAMRAGTLGVNVVVSGELVLPRKRRWWLYSTYQRQGGNQG